MSVSTGSSAHLRARAIGAAVSSTGSMLMGSKSVTPPKPNTVKIAAGMRLRTTPFCFSVSGISKKQMVMVHCDLCRARASQEPWEFAHRAKQRRPIRFHPEVGRKNGTVRRSPHGGVDPETPVTFFPNLEIVRAVSKRLQPAGETFERLEDSHGGYMSKLQGTGSAQRM